MHKEGVLEKARIVASRLDGLRTVLDDSDNSPGWKFSEHEMKGVPLRIEIGPKDIEKNQAVLVRRDTREKIFVSLENIETEASRLLDKIQSDMLSRAKEMLLSHIYDVADFEELCRQSSEKAGFFRAMWCGDGRCEEKIKEEAGLSSRCIPFEQKQISDKCICCGAPAKRWYIGEKAY